MEIKGIVNVKLECHRCGFDVVSMGVEVDAVSWEDFERQAMFGLPDGWLRIENVKYHLVTWTCPECQLEDSPKTQPNGQTPTPVANKFP